MRRCLLVLLLLTAACGVGAGPEALPSPDASHEIGCDGEPLPPRRASLLALGITGEERFRVPLPGPADEQSEVPPVEGERHVFVLFDGAVRALDSTSGEQRWEHPVDGPVYGMHLDADVLVLLLEQGSSSAHTVGLELATGEQRWRHDGPGPGLIGTPVLTGNGGIAWIAQGRTQVLDLRTGRIRWTGEAAGQEAALAVDGVLAGLVLRAVGDGVTAYDVQSGQERWRADGTGPDPVLHVVEESVVVGSGDGSVRALDLRTGEPLWEVNEAERLEVAGVGPDGVLLHRTGSPEPEFRLARLDTGRPRWSVATHIGQHLPALVGGGRVVTVDIDAEQTLVVGRSSEDGREVWRHDLGQVVLRLLRLGPDAVLAVTAEGRDELVAHVVDVPTGGRLGAVALGGSVSRWSAGERGALLQMEDPRPICPQAPGSAATPSTPPAP